VRIDLDDVAERVFTVGEAIVLIGKEPPNVRTPLAAGVFDLVGQFLDS
jgi:hypothetical protein